MKIALMDKFYFPETERTYTKEGYLVVPASISRPGTQLYKAIELVEQKDQLPQGIMPADSIVVYRSPEEVYKEEAVNSFKNVAVTNNHPPEFLNSKNHRKFSVGLVLSDVHPEAEKHCMAGTLKITDEETINEVKDGKVDVSAGYYSNIRFEEGVTPDGEHYQAVQEDIEGNHVAIVLRGRAGSDIKLSDALESPSDRHEQLSAAGITNESDVESSETKKRTQGEPEEELGMDGVPGSNSLSPFGDEITTDSALVEDEINDKEKELAMKLEDAMAKIADLEEANVTLSSQVLDQASIDVLVEDRMTLIDACSQLVDGLEYTGKSNIELKKEVLMSKMPKVELGEASEEYVNAAFDVMSAQLNDTVEGKHDEDVYGKDLALEDEGEETPEKPSEGEEAIEETKNTKEGENPDDSEAEAEKDEEPVEVKDSATLDQAFAIESQSNKKERELSAYEKHCKRSRDLWKN